MATTMTTIRQSDFPAGESGLDVKQYTLDNGKMSIDILDLGGTIASVRLPDRKGEIADVCLGFSDAHSYLTYGGYLGAMIGRYANRIGRGRFCLGGREYTLDCNDGRNHLHGGLAGFDKRLWEVRQEGEALILSIDSPDGEGGYPGNVSVQVRAALTEENELVLNYTAQSDADTILNLTNHSYWNLRGAGNGDILGHSLQLNASRFTRVDNEAIPTGELPAVDGTVFDFRTPHEIGERIGADCSDLKAVGGYDHNFVIDGSGFREAALLSEAESGRSIRISTDLPGIQLYAGNMLDGTLVGKGGVPYGKHAGVALETQFFPDSPNRPEFPSCLLRAGEEFCHTTVYRFGW